MTQTTLAFTTAKGSDGLNVLPQEAYVTGNMRFIHHQPNAESLKIISDIAAKYDIETEVIYQDDPCPIVTFDSDAFRLVERAVESVFPGVQTSPYVMTAASDSRYLSRVCDNCLRFTPFLISHEQMASIHGIDENVDLSTLAPAVDFYRYLISEA